MRTDWISYKIWKKCQKLTPEVKNCFANEPNFFWKNEKLFNKRFDFKMYLWTRKMQFWQTCLKIFSNTLRNFCQKSQNKKRTHILTISEFFPESIPLETSNDVSTSLMRFFWPKSKKWKKFCWNWTKLGFFRQQNC